MESVDRKRGAPRTRPLRSALLLGVLALVAVVAFHPHWNASTHERRELTTHMDAWVHWGRAKAALDEGTVAYREPFSPEGSSAEFAFRSDLHERGYHAYLAALKDASGVPWTTLWEYIPLAMTLLLTLAVFAVAERWGAGVEAALWVAAVPSTLRFLGPAFMVPVAFSLPLFVAGLFVLFHMEGRSKTLTLLIILAGLWPIHTMPALALTALAAVDAMIVARRDLISALVQLACAVLPLLILAPYIAGFLDDRAGVEVLPASIEDVRLSGAWLFLAAGVGAALLGARREGTRPAFLLTAVVGGAAGIAIVRSVADDDILGIYDRSLMLLYVAATILAGVGVAAAARLAGRSSLALGKARSRPSLRSASAAALALLVTLQAFAVLGAAERQLDHSYYYVVDETTYRSYELAASRLGPHHDLALVDGPSSMAFSIATGRPLVHTFTPGNTEYPVEYRDFFESGGRDTRLLVGRGITLVVTPRTLDNPDLVLVSPGVYGLRDDLAMRIAAAR